MQKALDQKLSALANDRFGQHFIIANAKARTAAPVPPFPQGIP